MFSRGTVCGQVAQKIAKALTEQGKVVPPDGKVATGIEHGIAERLSFRLALLNEIEQLT